MSLKDYSYPLDEWKIREIHFEPAMMGRNETIFALGNGHLGMRGNFEEGYCNVTNGTYLNGFFEESPIIYGETAYGYAKNRQVMLNVADAKVIRLIVNGEPFNLSTGNIIAYQRTLDLSTGMLSREVRWVSPGGKLIELKIRRLVSLERRHIAAIDYELAAIGGETSIEIESIINGKVTNQSGREDPRIGTRLDGRVLLTSRCEVDGSDGLLLQQTRTTQLTLACAMAHSIETDGTSDDVSMDSRCDEEEEQSIVRFRRNLGKNQSIRLQKFMAYCSSRDVVSGDIESVAQDEVRRARETSFSGLAAEQAAYVKRFWATADIEVRGDDAVQQGLRFNIFSLLQSAGRDGKTSIAAKGLTGEGYEGHYFWDTEIYVLPFFIYSDPEIARSLLLFRCGILDKARNRAAEMSQTGALFPWRTIGGEETSPYYPAGSAQYHIDADIVFALKKYLNAHSDGELLGRRAAELIFETARLWSDLGDWLPARGKRHPGPVTRSEEDAARENHTGSPDLFDTPDRYPGRLFYINEVTGPDEYTALVNNNTYTNMMAQFNLETAVEVARHLRDNEPEEYRRISQSIGLDDNEIDRWREAAAKMFIPYDPERGICAQDDAFFNRAQWDFRGTPKEKYPLLLNFHPLVIYRYQVLKQPDVVLAQVLRGDRFSFAEKKRNFDYYDPLTTGDSSLSPCIQSVAAAELGYTEQAYRYFMRTARMDLDDINRNVVDGVHTAAMAGTWISLVYGFAGMRDYDGHLTFDPRLPAEWSSLRLKLVYRGMLLSVDISHKRTRFELEPWSRQPERGAEEANQVRDITIEYRGKPVAIEAGKTVSLSAHPALECVVFDLDGVITDTAEYHFQAWSRIAEEAGAPIDRKFNERLKGVGRMESLDLILDSGGKHLGQEEKLELADRKNGYYRELIAAITPDDLLPGVASLLEALKSKGIKIAIASASHNVWEVVKRLQIGETLDFIVDPESVAKGKPDPEVFMRAAESLGLPFENCVGVEDAQAGIDAIKAARMFAVGIGSDLVGANWILSDTRGLTLDGLLDRFQIFAASRR